ncbi:monovalent cation:proton antiporter-2 (CPA2) family protein [Arenibaculum pallidiluteum]|uniref:monovalent cation:proton antiporter-2 (CPA2) family protein n=1 Tax=Arenibaculum pallidiluteum TaxID=2812559 RepID=UPI001A9793EC|nr:monovalent cation:proton antiporter-2 (CPA2) family protein [Arenibaculum pallidiluteum]
MLTVVVLLAAAVLMVPIARALGLGSVLGYLAAGLAIGPAGLGLVGDVEAIAHASELGVTLLLFLIGLELRPARLWVMRRSVFGLGGAQVVASAAAIGLAAWMVGLPPEAAVVSGFGLALSSTAMVLPMLSEKGIVRAQAGRDSFSILLFQDLAIIPAVALLPLLVGGEALPRDPWGAVGIGLAAVAAVLVGGRFLIRPIFRLVAAARAPEIFTATALLVAVGTAALLYTAGLSSSLGAFMAGVLLADSEYRHQLQADIEPFEGLLLGLFFVSIGMGADLGALIADPWTVAAMVLGLVGIKMLVVHGLARAMGHDALSASRMGVVLAQGGEFGFVLFGAAASEGILGRADASLLMLVITLSMLTTPVLFAFEERWLAPLLSRRPRRAYDQIEETGNPVIICGFGRVGQIVGRILSLRGIPYTALDIDSEQVDLVRRFGNTAYFGDPSRPDILRAAGAEEARLLVVALSNVEASLKVVEVARRMFPHLVILARARNRRHAHLLMDLGVRLIVRETLHSSVVLTEKVLAELGVPQSDINRTMQAFLDLDQRTLEAQHAFYQDEKQMIQTSRQAIQELMDLFEADRRERQGP